MDPSSQLSAFGGMADEYKSPIPVVLLNEDKGFELFDHIQEGMFLYAQSNF